MVNLSLLAGAGWQFFDNNGVPLAGGKLYTYAAGTTTPATTYTSSSGVTPHANPIILDSAGRVPSEVWLTLSTAYKFTLKTSANVDIWTKDNIPGIDAGLRADLASTATGNGSALLGFIQAGGGAVAQTAQTKMRQIVTPEDFGAVGNGTTDDHSALTNAFAAAVANNVPLVCADKIYAVAQDTLVIPGITMQSSGAIFRFTKVVTNTTPAVTIAAGFTGDALTVEIPNGVTRPYGIIATGDDITVGTIKITAGAQQAQLATSTDYAVKLTTGARHRIGSITVTNYDRAVVLNTLTDSDIGAVNVTSYVRGLLMVSCLDTKIVRCDINTRSVSASQTSGHNSILLTTNTNVTIEDAKCYDAGEHGIRVGGGPQKNISLVRPHVYGCQGSGIKVLSTDNAAPTAGEYIENLVIDSPVVEDVGSGGGSASNMCGIQLERINNAQILSPIIRTRLAINSCQHGMRFYGVTNVLVTNPIILNAAIDGIEIFTADSGAVNAPSSNVQILGGLIKDCGDDGIQMSATGSTILDSIVFSGTQLVANGNRGFVAAIASSGSFNNCFLNARFSLNVVDACVCTAAGWLMDCYGASTLASVVADNSSRWSNGTSFYIRKAGVWTAL